MAEIPIQRKERSRVWPWLLVLLLVAIVVGWYVWSRNNAGGGSVASDSTRTRTSNGAVVADSTPARTPTTPDSAAPPR
jgi:hypothetical protein